MVKGLKIIERTRFAPSFAKYRAAGADGAPSDGRGIDWKAIVAKCQDAPLLIVRGKNLRFAQRADCDIEGRGVDLSQAIRGPS